MVAPLFLAFDDRLRVVVGAFAFFGASASRDGRLVVGVRRGRGGITVVGTPVNALPRPLVPPSDVGVGSGRRVVDAGAVVVVDSATTGSVVLAATAGTVVLGRGSSTSGGEVGGVVVSTIGASGICGRFAGGSAGFGARVAGGELGAMLVVVDGRVVVGALEVVVVEGDVVLGSVLAGTLVDVGAAVVEVVLVEVLVEVLVDVEVDVDVDDGGEVVVVDAIVLVTGSPATVVVVSIPRSAESHAEKSRRSRR